MLTQHKGTIPVLSSVIIRTILHIREPSMANGIVVQLTVVSVLAAVFMCVFIVHMRRKAHRALSTSVPQVRTAAKEPVQKPESIRPKPMQIAEVQIFLETEMQEAATFTMETASTSVPLDSCAAKVSAVPVLTEPAVVVEPQPLASPENQNQRILAGISENLRKSP